MGRVSFAEAVYLLLIGELPSPAIGKLDGRAAGRVDRPWRHAALDAGRAQRGDHRGADAGQRGRRASWASATTTAATSRPRCACSSAAWLRAGGPRLRGRRAAARRGVIARGTSRCPGSGTVCTRTIPRAARLFQMALELDLDGQCLQMCRRDGAGAQRSRGPTDPRVPINVDGAIAAVCCDIGFPPELGHALFIISRVPGLIAQAHEEQERERPMRAIDSTAVVYDGPRSGGCRPRASRPPALDSRGRSERGRTRRHGRNVAAAAGMRIQFAFAAAAPAVAGHSPRKSARLAQR